MGMAERTLGTAFRIASVRWGEDERLLGEYNGRTFRNRSLWGDGEWTLNNERSLWGDGERTPNNERSLWGDGERTPNNERSKRGLMRFILIPHSPAHAFYRDPRSPALHHKLTVASAMTGHRRLNQNTPWPRRRQLAPPEPPPATVSTFLSSKTAIPREGLPPPSSPIPSWLATTFYSESKLTANNYPPVGECWMVLEVSV
ncbi:hypothetical protein LR48_Vigan10g253900 [Vigna angularis]|uniref:Uncharacterized protein n=1 Tax=Phaseolus angularis TaxID=3914 RepID=A0A0L9VP19_PHAAN|nr:hypothetical protein LR48_Vigan10g253900 [Vigna angularis]